MEIIDHNQKIYVILPDELDNFEKNIGRFTYGKNKLKSNSIEYLKKKIQFFRDNSKNGLYLGYYCIGKTGDYDTPIIFGVYNNGNKYQRVQLENATCEKCNSIWYVANPTYFELYPNNDFNINELQYPLLSCPKCNGKLSRCAIWIKPDEVIL